MTQPKTNAATIVNAYRLQESTGELWLPHNDIKPDPDQPRKRFKVDEIEQLATSIQSGQIEAIVVTVLPGDTLFTIVSGVRRWRAAGLLSEQRGSEVSLRATLLPCPHDDIDRAKEWLFEKALVANVSRQALDPLDEAAAFARIYDRGFSYEQIGALCNVSWTHVWGRVCLLTLDSRVQAMLSPDLLKAQQLDVSKAFEISRIKDKDEQYRVACEVLEKSLTVKELRERSRGYVARQDADPDRDYHYTGRGSRPWRTQTHYDKVTSLLHRTDQGLYLLFRKVKFDGLYGDCSEPNRARRKHLKMARSIVSNMNKLIAILEAEKTQFTEPAAAETGDASNATDELSASSEEVRSVTDDKSLGGSPAVEKSAKSLEAFPAELISAETEPKPEEEIDTEEDGVVGPAPTNANQLHLYRGQLVVDLDHAEEVAACHFNDEPVELELAEQVVLYVLAKNFGKSQTYNDLHKALSRRVKDAETIQEGEVVKSLRKKLEEKDKNIDLAFLYAPGRGYTLRDVPQL